MKGLLIQEFKTLFRSPAAISILIIPVVLMIGLGYILPSGWIIPSAVTIGIVASVLLYFGGSLEEIKRTSFMKSISLTRLNKFSFLSTKILFSIFISIISVLWVLLFAWIFTTPIQFLATDFSNLIPPSEGDGFKLVELPFTIDWKEVNWMLMIYAGIATIVVSITLAFVFVAFSRSSLSFYLMSFGYLLSMILFGGVVMPSFLIDKDSNGWFTYLYYIVPNYYTNNVMASAFSGGLIPSVIHSVTNDIIDPKLQPLFDMAQATNSDIQAIFADENSYSLIHKILVSYNKEGEFDPSKIKIFIDGVEDTTLTETNPFEYLSHLVSLINANPDSVITFKYGISSQKEITNEIFTNNLNSLMNGENWEYARWILTASLDKVVIHIDALFIHNALNSGSSFDLVNSLLIWANDHHHLVEDAIKFINTITGDKYADTISSVISIIHTIQNAYNNVSPHDYYVPWIETAAFLLIAARFFKWA